MCSPNYRSVRNNSCNSLSNQPITEGKIKQSKKCLAQRESDLQVLNGMNIEFYKTILLTEMPQTNMKAKSLNTIGSFSIFLKFNLVPCAFKFSALLVCRQVRIWTEKKTLNYEPPKNLYSICWLIGSDKLKGQNHQVQIGILVVTHPLHIQLKGWLSRQTTSH